MESLKDARTELFMLTKTDFEERLIRRIAEARSQFCRVYFREISPPFEVCEASKVDRAIYLRGGEEADTCECDHRKYIKLTHDFFLAKTYEDVLRQFLIVSNLEKFRMHIS